MSCILIDSKAAYLFAASQVLREDSIYFRMVQSWSPSKMAATHTASSVLFHIKTFITMHVCSEVLLNKPKQTIATAMIRECLDHPWDACL